MSTFVTLMPSGRVLLSGTTQFDPAAVQLPPAMSDVPPSRVGFVGGSFADMATLASFYIDPIGQKHPTDAGPGWQQLSCAWADVLVRDGSVWKAR